MTRILAALLLSVVASPAFALRCDGRVVSTGDHALTVIDRCGEPYWIDRYSTQVVTGEFSAVERSFDVDTEAWYYNFGPNRLLHRLVFRDNRLLREDTLGYGYSRLGRDCDLDTIAPGTTNGEIVARCGQPTSSDSRYAEIVQRDGAGNAQRRLVRREEWLFREGRRDPHLFIIVDGVVSQVERLPR